jgi:hypothetical protein
LSRACREGIKGGFILLGFRVRKKDSISIYSVYKDGISGKIILRLLPEPPPFSKEDGSNQMLYKMQGFSFLVPLRKRGNKRGIYFPVFPVIKKDSISIQAVDKDGIFS